MEQTEEVSKDYEELPLPSPPPMLESPESSISDSILPFGFPSLPEPTERPPPPPTVHQDEPIYEAIQPRFHAGFGEVLLLKGENVSFNQNFHQKLIE
jgi:hypothetical protein